MTVTPPRTEGQATASSAILSCYVDARTHAILSRVSAETGRTVEELAEAAIENAALEAARGDPPPPRSSGEEPI